MKKHKDSQEPKNSSKRPSDSKKDSQMRNCKDCKYKKKAKYSFLFYPFLGNLKNGLEFSLSSAF